MSKDAKNVHIIAILGTLFADNNTVKVLNLALDELRRQPDVQLDIIDPQTYALPFPGQKVTDSVGSLQKVASAAHGAVLITPEYHGSYSSVIKLIIENLGYPSVLAGKPVALLGVASGQIGAIKALEHLSSVCIHIGAVVLPKPVSVASVHKVFDKDGRCTDKELEEKIRVLAHNLVEYVRNTNPSKRRKG